MRQFETMQSAWPERDAAGKHPRSDLNCAAAPKAPIQRMSAASFQSATPNLQHCWRSSCLSVALDADQATSNYTCPTTPDSIPNNKIKK